MAVMHKINCSACGKSKTVATQSGAQPPLICHECSKEKESKAKKAHLAALSKLPLEERLKKIEEWVYDYRPQIPLSERRF